MLQLCRLWIPESIEMANVAQFKSFFVAILLFLGSASSDEDVPQSLDPGIGGRGITKVVYDTLTVTQTLTVINTAKMLCAQLVNITNSCRRRRDVWIDQPQILSFDDDMDDLDFMINPTEMQRMDSTALPSAESVKVKRDSGVGPLVIESSVGETAASPPEQRFFNNRPNLMGLLASVLTTSTATLTTFITTTTTSLTTTFKTFLIQGCTPSPFSYVLC